MRRKPVLTGLLLALCWTSAVGQTQLQFPEPKGWVNDFAHVLDAKTVGRLQSLSEEMDAKTHAQIAVVTVDSIPGDSIKSYAIALFNRWGIGHADDKRGVLILLSIPDHSWRIEVGRGFETLFPPKRTAKIGATMTPDLRRAQYSEAVWAAAKQIAQIVADDRGVTLTSAVAAQPRSLQHVRPHRD